MSQGTKEEPSKLVTAPGTSEYTMYRDEASDPPALVCQVGSTTLKYHLSAIEDFHRWLLERGDWVPLGAADENKPAAEGTVEAWGRSESNPVGGWYGLRKGYRGRFGMYLPPLLDPWAWPRSRTKSATTASGALAPAARPPQPTTSLAGNSAGHGLRSRAVRRVIWRRSGCARGA